MPCELQRPLTLMSSPQGPERTWTGLSCAALDGRVQPGTAQSAATAGMTPPGHERAANPGTMPRTNGEPVPPETGVPFTLTPTVPWMPVVCPARTRDAA